MKQTSLLHVAKKISRLEKEYESIHPEAILKKDAVEKKMRKLLIIEKNLKGYRLRNRIRSNKKEAKEHDSI